MTEKECPQSKCARNGQNCASRAVSEFSVGMTAEENEAAAAFLRLLLRAAFFLSQSDAVGSFKHYAVALESFLKVPKRARLNLVE